ncbi:MAG: hypothetical protein HYV42_05395 [Candidatus Magasanikbacteria bacterium]|nr:hypothetical protein [Candidatus Magasanikbacteria bacterium]
MATITVPRRAITRQPVPANLIQHILTELKLIRTQMMLLLPTESLEGYAHADRLKRSYRRTLKQYPPLA